MKRIGIAGFGTIGRVVARHIENSDLPLALAAVSAGDRTRAEVAMAQLARPVPIVDTDELVALSDVIVDSAPTAAFRDIAEATLCAGKTLVTVSGAALMQWPGAAGFARDHGGRIILATGALLGLDAVRAAAVGSIHSVTMVTRKPPNGLVGAPHLVENQIDVDGLTQPKCVFKGNAREAAKGFPANVNVAAALSLAGIGPDRTTIEVWADPTVTRNVHSIEVDSDSARFRMTMENIPSENPKTGRIVAQSVLALLRKMNANFRVGT